MRSRSELLAVALAITALLPASVEARTLSFDERVQAQRAIEQVYWNHRVWPKDNPGGKPALGAVMSDDAVRARVEEYLRESSALARSRRPITADQLQAELDRMAANTRDGETLRELFRALDDDPFVIAETLARQSLAGRMSPEGSGVDTVGAFETPPGTYVLPSVPATTCTEDAWTATRLDGTTPAARFDHTAVWTGAELIVWGGWTGASGTQMNTGSRYSPATDTWAATSVGANVPSARRLHSAVWTGTEMIVWGGFDGSAAVNTGGRYNPATNAWTATSTGANLPAQRTAHTAVWSGTEMIVWGGRGSVPLNSGGRYSPSGNSWNATSTAVGVPAARADHTAVWTGSEMIVWGGDSGSVFESTGGRYNPSTDGWGATSTVNAPPARVDHTAVWAGSDMIVWGGIDKVGIRLSSGGLYDPATNGWLPISSGSGLPSPRARHAAAWTGTEMIVWGGATTGGVVNTGARYTPATNTWTATPTTAGVPTARSNHSASWTGNEVVVWGGSPTTASGGRYCVQSCAAPSIWYPDQDNDGFGPVSAAVQACTQPGGYTATPGDCNDADPAIHPGAAEVCNGIDDDCDASVDEGAAPAEADNGLRAAKSAGAAMLTWNLPAGAATSDVLRGLVNALPVGPGGADETCLANGVAVLTLTDGDSLPSGRSFWYLVRGRNACGIGTYGFQEQNGVPTVVRVSTTCP